MNIPEDVLAEKLLAVATPIMVSQRCGADEAIKKARELFEKCQQAAKTMLNPVPASRDLKPREAQVPQPMGDDGAGAHEHYNDQQEPARRTINRPQTSNNSTAREIGFAAAARQTGQFQK